MFENNRISSVQIQRLLVLSTLGISLLTTTDISLRFGKRDGLFCILLSYIFSLLYTAMVFCFIKKKRHKTALEKKERKISTKLAAGCLIVKYFFLITPVLCLFTQLVRKFLVPQRSIWIVMTTILVACLLLALQGIEAMGRLSQCLYCLVLVVCILPAICLLPKADSYYSSPLYYTSIRTMLTGSFWTVLLLFPLELLYLGSDNFDTTENLTIYAKKCYQGISLVYLLNGIYYVTNLGNLSMNVIQSQKDIPATVQLLNQIRVSNFLLLFFLLSLCFTISILLYAILELFRYLLPESLYRQPKISRRILIGIVGIAVFFLAISTFYLAPQYETARFASTKRSNIEHRIYANGIILSYDDEKQEYTMSLIFPKKEGKPAETKELSSPSLTDLTSEYARSGNKELDFSHTEVLLLTGSIYEKPEHFQATVDYLNSLDKFNHKTLICGIDATAKEFLEMSNELDVALGEYLSRMTKTNLPFAKTTLEQLKKVSLQTEPACVIAKFSIEDDQPYYNGNLILSKDGLVEAYNVVQSAVINLIYGKKEFLIPFGKDYQYKISDNDYIIRNHVTDKGIVQTNIIYQGTAEVLKKDDLSESTLNKLLSIVIEKQLTTLMTEHGCDFLNICKHLSIDQPALYVRYLENQKDFYKKCRIRVKCRYKIAYQ